MYTTLISAAQLQKIDNTLIIDVRHELMNPNSGRLAYQSEHITNAHFLHLDDDLSGKKNGQNGRHPLPNLDELASKLQILGLNVGQQIVFYDADNSTMAARAWWLLRHMGHEAVAVLDGGFAAWLRLGGLTQTGIQTTTAEKYGNFIIQPSLNTVVCADDLLLHLNDHLYQIIDARSPERFNGEIEPIDPVSGHIPHAQNYFCMLNLNSDGTFKDASTLKTQWQDFFQQPNIVNQCGSGITACHNMLAQHIAGFSNSSLYPGSWSEWCSDASRPIARGA